MDAVLVNSPAFWPGHEWLGSHGVFGHSDPVVSQRKSESSLMFICFFSLYPKLREILLAKKKEWRKNWQRISLREATRSEQSWLNIYWFGFPESQTVCCSHVGSYSGPPSGSVAGYPWEITLGILMGQVIVPDLLCSSYLLHMSLSCFISCWVSLD